jgi:hypothetical protein
MKKLRIFAILALASTTLAAHAQILESNTSADCNQNLQTFTQGLHPFHAGITLALMPQPSPYLIFALGALVLGARLTRQ